VPCSFIIFSISVMLFLRWQGSNRIAYIPETPVLD
jgi:hypothetical protein